MARGEEIIGLNGAAAVLDVPPETVRRFAQDGRLRSEGTEGEYVFLLEDVLGLAAKQLRELTQPCEQPGQAEMDPTRIICQREFSPEGAASMYTEARYPSNTILPLTDEEIDAVTGWGYAQLPRDEVFTARGVSVPLPAGTVLPAADQFILSIIQQAWGDRPLYFAMTTNSYRNVGFSSYIARQGLAFQLVTPEEAQAKNLVPVPPEHPWSAVTGAFVDVPRTRDLLWNEFEYGDLLSSDHWPDDATRGIPSYYGFAHLALSYGEQILGNEAEVQRNAARAEEWLGLAER